MTTESEELKALSFVRRSLLRKNEKIRELTKKVETLSDENDSLKWKCADQQTELEALKESLNEYRQTELRENEEDISQDAIEAHDNYDDTKHDSRTVKVKEESNIQEIEDEYDVSNLPPHDTLQQAQDSEMLLPENNSGESLEQSDYAAIEMEGQQNMTFSEQAFIQQQLDSQQSTSNTHHHRVSTVQAAGSGGSPQISLDTWPSPSDVVKRGTFLCRFCSKPFRSRVWVERHERSHTGEKPFMCALCPARFTQRVNLKSHVITRHPECELFRCTGFGKCCASFVEQSDLTAHMKKSHGVELGSSASSPDCA